MAVDRLIELRDIVKDYGEGEVLVVPARRPGGRRRRRVALARTTADRAMPTDGRRVVAHRAPDGIVTRPRGERAGDFLSEIRRHRAAR